MIEALVVLFEHRVIEHYIEVRNEFASDKMGLKKENRERDIFLSFQRFVDFDGALLSSPKDYNSNRQGSRLFAVRQWSSIARNN